MMRIIRTKETCSKQLAQAFLKKTSDLFYNDTANLTETLDFDTRKCISDANNLVPSAGDEAVVVTKKF